MKKAAIIISSRDFQDKEYLDTKKVLESEGIETINISDKKGLATGTFGEKIQIDKTLSDISAKDFDAIIFIGGPGALNYLDNENSYKIIKETIEAKKILAAICIAPVILAKAGILKGKKATVWSPLPNSQQEINPIKILQNNSAEYIGGNTVVDGNIITANGPMAAREFGQKISNSILSAA